MELSLSEVAQSEPSWNSPTGPWLLQCPGTGADQSLLPITHHRCWLLSVPWERVEQMLWCTHTFCGTRSCRELSLQICDTSCLKSFCSFFTSLYLSKANYFKATWLFEVFDAPPANQRWECFPYTVETWKASNPWFLCALIFVSSHSSPPVIVFPNK